MLRRLVIGVGFLSATVWSYPAFSADGRVLQIIVSKNHQSMAVYDGTEVVARTKISSGKPGHETPSGIFSILEKEKYHESNIYSNAPMPFMQRITWSGIALHEGVVPNHPASHGCVRMPASFAKTLYGMTERGAQVIISEDAVVPQKIEDMALFVPRRPLPNGPLLPDAELRTSSIKAQSAAVASKADGKPVEVAMNIAPANPLNHDNTIIDSATAAEPVDTAPLRILITRRGDRENLMDTQAMLQELGFETGGTDGFAGPLTRSAIAGFKRWKNISTKGALTSPEFLDALYEAAGKPKPPAGQIMVRRNFEPLFEAPVGIKDPGTALGTHLYTVDKIDRGNETAEWTAVTVPNKLPEAMRKRLGITMDSDPSVLDAAKVALDRIDIPHDIRERIETLMGDGTSITINDQGLGPDTGKGTDFITITRPGTEIASIENVSASTADVGAEPEATPHKRSIRRYQKSIGLY